LRKYTNSISSPTVRAFLEESVTALEYRLLRSAVVLSWVGALSVLYEVVIKKHLKDFNAEAQRRSSNWKPAKTLDDLTAMKEYDFLQMITSISVIEGLNGLR
jgi:hypothetical protein